MDCLHQHTPSDQLPCKMCRVLHHQVNWVPKDPPAYGFK
jgi:hypothetical protein